MSKAAAVLLASRTRRAPAGLVRADGKAMRDDGGLFHPLGITFFWALYGWKFERDRVLAHLDYIAPFRFDYVRILGEVDWEGRSIDPYWTDWQDVCAGFIDAAYERGMRTQMTMTGGKQASILARRVAEQFVPVVRDGREHTLFSVEITNEYDRLDKITLEEMEREAKSLRPQLPHLMALSRPRPLSDEHDDSGFAAMFDAMRRSGANLNVLHPRRSGNDYGWAHVRQGYDFAQSPYASSNNEPEGPQSSVVSEGRPRMLAMARALGIVCGGAAYVFHPGQMVTGRADAQHGRPENLWEVPGIEEIMRAVRGVDAFIPDGVENWTVVNNARNTHPLPLNGTVGIGFWELGKAGGKGSVNKNYAALSGNRWVVVLAGVQRANDNADTHVGTAIRPCHVDVFDPIVGHVASAELAAGKALHLPGGYRDQMPGYLVHGRYI